MTYSRHGGYPPPLRWGCLAWLTSCILTCPFVPLFVIILITNNGTGIFKLNLKIRYKIKQFDWLIKDLEYEGVSRQIVGTLSASVADVICELHPTAGSEASGGVPVHLEVHGGSSSSR